MSLILIKTNHIDLNICSSNSEDYLKKLSHNHKCNEVDIDVNHKDNCEIKTNHIDFNSCNSNADDYYINT